MPVESTADRAVFTNPEEYGVVATYQPQIGDSVTVNGRFDDEYRLGGDGFSGANHAGSELMFYLDSADVPASARHGDTLTIAGEGTFKVVEIMPGSQGMTTLRLQEA